METENTKVVNNDNINILIVGAKGVGKTTLTRTLMGFETLMAFEKIPGNKNNVNDDMGKYSGTIFDGKYTGMNASITVFDTPGYTNASDHFYRKQVLIANQIDTNIHAVVLVLNSEEFNEIEAVL